MEQIPYTSGKFSYLSHHPTKAECEKDAKKLKKKKADYKIVTKRITEERGFWATLFNTPAKKKTLYILYVK